jgi:hypothetical protein
MAVTLDSTLFSTIARSTDTIGRVFLSAEEAHTRRYNTRVFHWTPGSDDDPTPGHYIYCNNDKGVINWLSCAITLYDRTWREIEYNEK